MFAGHGARGVSLWTLLAALKSSFGVVSLTSIVAICLRKEDAYVPRSVFRVFQSYLVL
jgi:hypothetical protein